MRNLLRHCPWIVIGITLIFLLSPYGLDFFYLSFLSGEQLSRNIAQPFFIGGLAILAVFALLEWYVRMRRERRRRRDV